MKKCRQCENEAGTVFILLEDKEKGVKREIRYFCAAHFLVFASYLLKNAVSDAIESIATEELLKQGGKKVG